MDFTGDLSGRTALVTGASRGLGRAVALALGKAGVNVAVTDLLLEGEEQDKANLGEYSPLAKYFTDTGQVMTQSTAEEIEMMGSKALALKMDVTKPEEIQEVVRNIKETLDSVDILVNNAGVMDNFALIENQDLAKWERDLRVNITGAFLCAKSVWPGMVEKKWGRIINISSIAGLMGAFGQPSYGATKAGLVGLTRSLALEGARHSITVNAVLPGFIETEAVKLQGPEILERYKNRTAIKRLGSPEEVASLILYLASEQASYITGAAIPVAGGADLLTF
jgi:3-oxoacyl-[acyl-carrier protein] reductase